MLKRDSTFVAKTNSSNQNKRGSTTTLNKEYIKVAKEFAEVTGRDPKFVFDYNDISEISNEKREEYVKFMKTMISMEKFADAPW